MPKTSHIAVPVILLIIGVAVGYGVAFSIYQSQVSSLQGDVATLRDNVDALQAQLNSAESQVTSLSGRLQGLLVPAVTILSYPLNVSTGEHFVVAWNVTGGIPGKITYTAIHWGKVVGVSPAINFYDYPNISQIFIGDTPQSFRTDIASPAEPGTIVIRAHAIVDGVEVWSDEKSISVDQPQDFNLELDLRAFTMRKGDSRKISVTISSVGSFSSQVALTFADLPPGIAATLSQTVVTLQAGGRANASISLDVSADATPGTYSFMIVGTSGNITRSDALTITITEPLQPMTVEIRSFAYNPSSISVPIGTTVTWVNRDSVLHTVTGKGWDSGDIQQDQSWSYTFTSAGTFDYYCIYHPYMVGKVVVTP